MIGLLKLLTICTPPEKENDCPGFDVTRSLWFTWAIHSNILSTSKGSAYPLMCDTKGRKICNLHYSYVAHTYCILLSSLQNALMQQHLAHLYFVTVLEQLQTRAYSMRINFLIRRALKYSEVS